MLVTFELSKETGMTLQHQQPPLLWFLSCLLHLLLLLLQLQGFCCHSDTKASVRCNTYRVLSGLCLNSTSWRGQGLMFNPKTEEAFLFKAGSAIGGIVSKEDKDKHTLLTQSWNLVENLIIWCSNNPEKIWDNWAFQAWTPNNRNIFVPGLLTADDS